MGGWHSTVSLGKCTYSEYTPRHATASEFFYTDVIVCLDSVPGPYSQFNTRVLQMTLIQVYSHHYSLTPLAPCRFSRNIEGTFL